MPATHPPIRHQPRVSQTQRPGSITLTGSRRRPPRTRRPVHPGLTGPVIHAQFWASSITLTAPCRWTNPRRGVVDWAGRSACHSRYAALPDCERGMAQAEEFRQFAWLLSADQLAAVDAVVNTGIRQYHQMFLTDIPLATRTAEAASASTGTGGAASSETALAVAVPCSGGASSAEKDSTASKKKRMLEALFPVATGSASSASGSV